MSPNRLDTVAYRVAAGLPRRQLLLGLLTGAAAAVGGRVFGTSTLRAESGGSGAESIARTDAVVLLDFSFDVKRRPARSRLVLINRQMGKIGLTNERQVGVMPSVLQGNRKVELSFYDLTKGVTDTPLLTRIVVPVSAALTALPVDGVMGLAVGVSAVMERDAALSEGELDACCVHCDGEKLPPTCGAAVCCATTCGDPCGACCDTPPPGQNCKDWCAPPPLV